MTTAQDDAIASLMEELGRKQGYVISQNNERAINQDSTAIGTGSDEDDRGRMNGSSSNPLLNHVQRIQGSSRLRPELDGYPTNNFLAGSHSIWNPLVAGDDPSCGTSRRPSNNVVVNTLPTNPLVEVIRRRVYEKFRHEAQILIRDFQDHKWTNSSHRMTKTAVSMKLTIPSMLEKWHMDSKLHERCHIDKNVTAATGMVNKEHPTVSSNGRRNLTVMTSTVQIAHDRQRLVNQNMSVYDPILLSKAAPPLFMSVLRPEVQKAWRVALQKANDGSTGFSGNNNHPSHLPPKFEKEAKQLQGALYRLVCEAMDSFERQLQISAHQESVQSDNSHRSLRKQPKIVIPPCLGGGNNSESPHHPSLVQVTFSGVSFRLRRAYMEKLQRLYDRSRYSRSNDDDVDRCPSFAEALFCLLCRYDTIQGAGLQAGVPGAVMDVLLREFDCRFECFASPLNCRYDRFGSAFEDIDAWFGSVGSFFDVFKAENVKQGTRFGDVTFDNIDDNDDGDDEYDDGQMEPRCYQANPPFCDGLILQLNDRIEKLLSTPPPLQTLCPGSRRRRRRRHERPVMFIVFVPAWRNAPCYQALLANSRLQHHLLLRQGHHWYTEGTQHRRRDSFRVASFDTSVLFYQNDAARAKWNLIDNDDDDSGGGGSNRYVTIVMDELRRAFSDDPGHMNKEETDTHHNIIAGTSSSRSRGSSHTTGSISSKQDPSKKHGKNVVAVTENEGSFKGRATTKNECTDKEDTIPIRERSTKDSSISNQKPTKKLASQDNNQGHRESESSENKNERKRKYSGNNPPVPTAKRRTIIWNEIDEGRSQLELLKSMGLSSLSTTATLSIDHPPGDGCRQQVGRRIAIQKDGGNGTGTRKVQSKTTAKKQTTTTTDIPVQSRHHGGSIPHKKNRKRRGEK